MDNRRIMSRRALKRFLLSGDAIQVHLLFGALAVLLAYSLWSGEAQADYGWGLLFCVVACPVILGLMWWQNRADLEAAARELEESLTERKKLRRKRRLWRMGSLVFVAGVAVGLVVAGNNGLVIESLPAQYLGYALIAVAGLGLAGVNIWFGGPLDPRLDPPTEAPEDS